MGSASLFILYWEECYNLDRKQFTVALVYVRIYSLLNEFFEPHILEGIEITIGAFVKNLQITKHQ